MKKKKKKKKKKGEFLPEQFCIVPEVNKQTHKFLTN
jgi:hypothetical protein